MADICENLDQVAHRCKLDQVSLRSSDSAPSCVVEDGPFESLNPGRKNQAFFRMDKITASERIVAHLEFHEGHLLFGTFIDGDYCKGFFCLYIPHKRPHTRTPPHQTIHNIQIALRRIVAMC